ncbi:MAG: hypothetical protein O2955_17105 [Planctomycetota bacterium]|nr:hypothetical protein [Planctomycetota bacterium]MDA1214232.1 hypothetical protein [Planctomycetota bacterium]
MQDSNEPNSSNVRKAKSPFGTVAALGVLCLVIGYFYLFPPFPRTFAKAIITFHNWRDHREVASGKVIELGDEKSLRELISYLPGVGQKRFAMMSGGWISSVVVELHAPDGEIVEVDISDDLADFSDRYGLGDGRVRRGLDRFLLARLKPESPASR